MPVIQQFSLDGQVAIVTGAAAGIGRRIAEVFADAGADVVVSDLDLDAATEVASAINATGRHAISAACNVTKEDDRIALVERAITTFGKVTVLANNAQWSKQSTDLYLSSRFITEFGLN